MYYDVKVPIDTIFLYSRKVREDTESPLYPQDLVIP